MADHTKEISEMMSRIETGMSLAKCRKCGCMAKALDAAESLAVDTGESEILHAVHDYRQRMDQIAYECLGCKKCYGAEASNFAHEAGGDRESACSESAKIERGQGWPVVAGDYVVGNRGASVAVCTLRDADLPAMVVSRAGDAVAIAGRCETENIGIEKIVLNIVSNPSIRWLVLCGTEPEGHLPGNALLKLRESGVDANMRVLETAARRPVLKNLSLVEVARFREQVEIIDRIGCADPDEIATLVDECANRAAPRLPEWNHQARRVPHVEARPPESLKLDRTGFFIIIPDHTRGVIACEHYSNDGTITTVIEGASARLIASTAIEKGLVSQLDHAAYLGRELARAEMSMRLGVEYVQDRAVGELPAEQKKGKVEANEHKGAGSCACSDCH